MPDVKSPAEAWKSSTTSIISHVIGAVMYCKECGELISDDARFCGNCGVALHESGRSGAITTGVGSINIGLGNMPNSHIHIGDRFHLSGDSVGYQLNRTRDVRTPVKTVWVFIAGAMGFIASLLDLLSHFDVSATIAKGMLAQPLVASISVLLFVVGLILWRHKFLWLHFFGLEMDSHGYIHVTDLKGVCPKCGSDLSVRYFGPKGGREIVAICSRNPGKHLFAFDPTELPDI